MAIIVRLDRLLAERKIKLRDLAEQVGITTQNLSILKTGKTRAIRFSTLDRLCLLLQCQPGDLLEHRAESTSPSKLPADFETDSQSDSHWMIFY
jgi:putative transcriptional regulator